MKDLKNVGPLRKRMRIRTRVMTIVIEKKWKSLWKSKLENLLTNWACGRLKRSHGDFNVTSLPL